MAAPHGNEAHNSALPSLNHDDSSALPSAMNAADFHNVNLLVVPLRHSRAAAHLGLHGNNLEHNNENGHLPPFMSAENVQDADIPKVTRRNRHLPHLHTSAAASLDQDDPPSKAVSFKQREPQQEAAVVEPQSQPHISLPAVPHRYPNAVSGGRGTGFHSRKPNVNFIEAVDRHLQAWIVSQTEEEKIRVVNTILNEMRRPFVSFNSTSGRWEELPRRQTKVRVRTALRTRIRPVAPSVSIGTASSHHAMVVTEQAGKNSNLPEGLRVSACCLAAFVRCVLQF